MEYPEFFVERRNRVIGPSGHRPPGDAVEISVICIERILQLAKILERVILRPAVGRRISGDVEDFVAEGMALTRRERSLAKEPEERNFVASIAGDLSAKSRPQDDSP